VFAASLFATVFALYCSSPTKDPDVGGGLELDDKQIPENAVGKTQDGKDVRTFEQGHFDYVLTKIDTAKSSSEDGFRRTLTFKGMTEDGIPNVGDIMVSSPTRLAPSGFAYKVLKVETDKSGGAVVEVRTAALSEIFAKVNFEGRAEIGFDAGGNPVSMRTLSKTTGNTAGDSGSFEKTFRADTVFSILENSSLKAGVEYTISFNYAFSTNDYKLTDATFYIEQKGNLTFETGVEGNYSDSTGRKLKSIKLPQTNFTVGVPPAVVPVVFDNDLEVFFQLLLEAQGGANVKYALDGHSIYGFSYSNGETQKIDYAKFTPSLEFEQYVKGSIRGSILFELNTKLYGDAGVSLSAGPGLRLDVSGDKLIGNFVFDNGFREEYKNYTSFWDGITPRDVWTVEWDSTFKEKINKALKDNEKKAERNSQREIKNEVKLSLGAQFGARVSLKAWDPGLFDWEVKPGFEPVTTLYRTSILPNVYPLDVNVTDNGVEIKTKVERDFLNYPVINYGLCVETPNSDDCKNGKGIRDILGSAGIGKAREFTAVFENLTAGETYHIRPFFSNGIGGMYYDKATEITIPWFTLRVNKNPAEGGTVIINGAGPAASEVTIHKAGAEIMVNALPSAGYEFAGWSGLSTSTGISVNFDDETSAAATFTMPESNIAIAAKFEAIASSVAVTYDGSGNSAGGVPVDNTEYVIGASVTVLDAGTLVKTGFAFNGWNTEADGSGSAYEAGAEFTINANIILYAQWTAIICTLHYNGNGSSGGIAPADSKSPYQSGEMVTVLGGGALVKTGFTFGGWNTEADGSGSAYQAGETFIISSNTTLYAQWTAITYIVTYNDNGSTGGLVPTDNTEYYGGVPVTVLGSGTLVKTGYTFNGWNTKADGSGSAYQTGGTFILSADVKLFAQWKFDKILGSFTDSRNGRVYRTTEINGKTWMAENLNYGGHCYEPDSCSKYGMLYYFFELKDVCPSGWRLPTSEEWQSLVDFAGGDSSAGAKLKSTSGWHDNGNGTDDFGFSALPGGRNSALGTAAPYRNAGECGYWWTSTVFGEFNQFANYRYMYSKGDYVLEFVDSNSGGREVNVFAFSIRCVKDD
jgi:uncharacterized protein (TIGR02145 family)/uncharacterized repeat protein (TIGR02543 family)